MQEAVAPQVEVQDDAVGRRGPARAGGPVSRVRVLVVDDCDVMHLGFRTLLTAQPWVERCVVANDPASAVELAGRYDPHVVILDPGLGDGAGMRLVRAVREAASDARVVLLTSGAISIATARYHDAAALLPKRARLDHVTRVIRDVAGGGTYLRRDDLGVAGLSPRECDVLALLADGETNGEIAARLHLSRDTVKQHAAAIYRKLGVRNRTEAARRADELGLTRAL